MSFPTYPRYRDPGVEWLGDVPEHWEVKRLGYYFTERRERVSDRDFPALSVTKLGVVPQLDTAAKTDDNDNRKRVCSGDFVINSRSDRNGSAGVSARDGSVSLINTVLRPEGAIHGPFIHHLLRSPPFQAEFNRFGKGIVADLWSTNYSEMRNIVLAMPPLDEQISIARFLDRDTANVDSLIAEQQRLVALLVEKRQAVISYTVTKGLNQDTPMRPSEIGWLGEVPTHWKLLRLKHISPFITVGIVVNPSSFVADEGKPFIYGGDIREGVLDWRNARRIGDESSEENQKTQLHAGDLLTVRVGAPGVTAVVTPECEGGNCASVMLVRQGDFNSAWLCFVMNARIVRYQVELVQYGAAQEQFNIGHAINFWVPTPPRAEQDEIARFLSDETARTDALVAEAEGAIALLQERRAALIAGAVTGKIDIRGLVGTKVA